MDNNYDNDYASISNICEQIDNNINIIYEDIKNIDEYYDNSYKYINNKKITYFSIYINDIFFQKHILEIEINNIVEIYHLIKRKLYTDLYTLYIKLNKTHDIENHHDNIKKIDENDIDEEVSPSDIKNICLSLNKIIDDITIYLSHIDDDIKINISKEDNGYPVDLLLICLNNEKNNITSKILASKSIYKNIIANSHKLLSIYLDKIKHISNDLIDNIIKLI